MIEDDLPPVEIDEGSTLKDGTIFRSVVEGDVVFAEFWDGKAWSRDGATMLDVVTGFPLSPEEFPEAKFEIPSSFEATNIDGDRVSICLSTTEVPEYFEVDDKPVAFVSTESGGMATVLFSNPPRLFPGSRVLSDGRKISKEEFAQLVKEFRAGS
jgi:hypothetical protein